MFIKSKKMGEVLSEFTQREFHEPLAPENREAFEAILHEYSFAGRLETIYRFAVSLYPKEYLVEGYETRKWYETLVLLTPSPDEQKENWLEWGSPEWYAEQILTELSLLHQIISQGNIEHIVAQSITVGILYEQAKLVIKWNPSAIYGHKQLSHLRRGRDIQAANSRNQADEEWAGAVEAAKKIWFKNPDKKLKYVIAEIQKTIPLPSLKYAALYKRIHKLNPSYKPRKKINT